MPYVLRILKQKCNQHQTNTKKVGKRINRATNINKISNNNSDKEYLSYI